jgi:hypothetical protein
MSKLESKVERPETFNVPLTSKIAFGIVLPIPTFPSRMTMLSLTNVDV